MKKTFLTVLLFYIFTGIAVAQNLSKTTEYKILLTGASFASPQNGWFEIGCRKLNAEAINRAIGGEAIANTANRMANGTLYSKMCIRDRSYCNGQDLFHKSCRYLSPDQLLPIQP